MDKIKMDNGLYVMGVSSGSGTSYYQVMVADNFIEIRDFTTHAKILDVVIAAADDVRLLLNRILGGDCNTAVFIDEVMDRCSCQSTRS